MSNVLYALEQGIENPRDGEINWMHYETHESLASAKAEARVHRRGQWRIVEMRCVWQSSARANAT